MQSTPTISLAESEKTIEFPFKAGETRVEDLLAEARSAFGENNLAIASRELIATKVRNVESWTFVGGDSQCGPDSNCKGDQPRRDARKSGYLKDGDTVNLVEHPSGTFKLLQVMPSPHYLSPFLRTSHLKLLELNIHHAHSIVELIPKTDIS
jgi:hypothetical protein